MAWNETHGNATLAASLMDTELTDTVGMSPLMCQIVPIFYPLNGPDTMRYIPKTTSPSVQSCATMLMAACWLPPP